MVTLTQSSPKQTELSAAKRALLQKRLQGKLKKPTEPQSIPKSADGGPLLLSFAEQRLWFLEQFEGGHPTYNEPLHAKLTGPLNVTALERALQEIVRRHETLRSCFKNVDGQAVKEVLPKPDCTLPVEDLRHLSPEQQTAEIERRQRENAGHIFDLAECPLFRVALLRVAEEEYLLLLTFHHIIYDGWSINVLMHELKTLYKAFAKGRPSPLDDLPVQYSDFARWQRQWMKGDALDRQMDYWRAKLNGPIPTLDFPLDHPRPPQQTFTGKQYRFQLSKDLSDRLNALSKQEKCTLSMTLLAAFKVLLYRYTGQADILVGSAVANRTRTEFEPLIGMFVNTLVLRTELSGNPTFPDLLRRVRQTLLEAQDHQDLPFDMLIEELLPQRDLSHTPFFQVWFNFQNFEVQHFRLGETTFQEIPYHTETAKFDLTMHILNSNQGFQVFMEYNTALLEEATILRMAGHFRTLLEGIVAHPNRPIAEFPILTPAEAHQILVEWNDTQTDYPKDTCIYELFEAQVNKTPESPAVIWGEQRLTYQELNCRANQVARHLRKNGIQAGTRVGICVERSLDMIIGLFGILKAGGTYVPLDPEYPEERLTFMLEDCQAPVLLTQEKLRTKLSGKHARVICLDTDWKMISKEDEENLGQQATPDDLIYIIYTSGSTGKPKGAGVYHRSFTNMVNWFVTEFDITADDSDLLISSFNFDLTQKNIYAPLIRGGRLHLPRSAYYEPSEIIQTIHQHYISWVNCTPSAFHALVECSEPNGFRALESLRYAFLGGEPISIPNLLKWIKSDRFHTKIVNTYGPTECTDISNSYILENPERFLEENVPLGKPIFNVTVLILDQHFKLVPVGVPGELCITGESVGIGYLNNPELTREKFIPNPYRANESAPLLYRTGDLARYLPDGNIEFLGRIDHQVKIRGFRIELGEIEAILSSHPTISKVVVIAKQDTSGTKRLVAYIVPCEEQNVAAHELRDFLKGQLPEYMIPSAFICLKEFPLTPNGKIDRRVLPDPEVAGSEAADKYVAPRNEGEQSLVKIWSDILGKSRIGIYDDFFDSGGHSLAAMQLVAKLSKTLNVALSVRDIFLYPTIAKLQAHLAEVSSHVEQVVAESSDIPLTPESVTSKEQAALYQFEYRPLLALIAVKRIVSVDAAFLDYPTTALVQSTGLSRDELMRSWCHNMATVYNLVETAWGRTAGIMLPLLDTELFSEKERLLTHIIDALEIAALIGARTVTLTGLLGFATNYGLDVVQAIAGKKNIPEISTGHAAISSAYLLNIEALLQRAGRHLAQECAAFIDLGSLGATVLRLMLRCLPHPKEIMLCDLSYRSDTLERIRQELETGSDFHGNVRIVPLGATFSPEIYDATLFVSAFNISGLLDIVQVKPRSLIVNPSCFDSARVFQRFEEREDILFTAGGVLRTPYHVTDLTYRPYSIATDIQSSHLEAFNSKASLYDIPSCTFSSILTSCFEELPATTGIVEDDTTLQHYESLKKLGCRGVDLHVGNYVLPEASIQNFYRRFSKDS